MLENAAFLVYLFGTLLPNIKTVTGVSLVVTLIFLGVYLVVLSISWSDNIESCHTPKQDSVDAHKRGLKRLPWLVTLVVVFMVTYTLSPSSEQSYGILATVGVVELSQTEEVQAISKNAYNALNSYFLSIKPAE